jgi:PleD family two-component response regulator
VEQEPVSAGAARIGVTLSAGLAAARAGDSGFDAVLLRADKALFGAKSSGRNRVERAA